MQTPPALLPTASTPATRSAGQLIVGGSLSLTVPVNLHVAVLPAASVTRNTLVVTPTGKAAPLVNPPICVVSAPGQLSVPTGVVKLTTALHRPASLVARMSAGQLIVGGSLSLTVTVKLQVAVLPAASVSRTTLVVTPTGKAAPLVNPPVCVVSAPAQLSVPNGVV